MLTPSLMRCEPWRRESLLLLLPLTTLVSWIHFRGEKVPHWTDDANVQKVLGLNSGEEWSGKWILNVSKVDPGELEGRKVWISMSICWLHNIDYHRKTNFDYAYAARLASLLWMSRTGHRVILQVVHLPSDADSPSLIEYLETLRLYGVTVEKVAALDIACPLKSQLQRLFAFTSSAIEDRDLIVMSDADAFVADPNIFEALKENHLVWILQYRYVEWGGTIPMCFVAASKRLWRNLVQVPSAESLLSKYHKPMDLGAKNMFDLDQLILTRLVLETGLCPPMAENRLWSRLGLAAPKPTTPRSDPEICFKGYNFGNCNPANNKQTKVGCKWFHFTPDSTRRDLLDTYEYLRHFDGPYE